MLGLNINGLTQQHLDFIGAARSPVTFLLNPKVEHAALIKSRYPAGKLIGRPHIRDSEVHSWYLGPGTAEGARAAGKRAADYCLAQGVPQMDAWILLNEPPVGSLEQIRLLAEFDAEFVRAMNRAGSRACIGAFSRGTPEVPSLDGGAALMAYLPALQVAHEVGAWLAIHQYGWYPLFKEHEWHVTRWQEQTLPWLRARGYPVPKYVVTECGVDLNTTPGGWKATPYNEHPQGYAELLLQLMEEYAKDPDCLGATIYCAGDNGDPRWHSFMVDGPLLNILASMTWPRPAAVSQPAPQPIPTPKPGGAVNVVKKNEPQSKHYSSREGRAIQYLVLHTTESPANSDQQDTLEYLTENERGVSINDYLAKFPDGTIRLYNMVPYSRASHHAGGVKLSSGIYSSRLPNGYRGHECNMRTIGLEIYRQAEGGRIGADVVEAAIDWAAEKCRQFNLTTSQILSHAMVDPTRRSDPVGIDLLWFRDRVGEKLGAMTQAPLRPPLPEDEPVTDLKTFLQKAAYWSEEQERQYAAGQYARASAIRQSMIKLLGKARDKWAA